MIDRLVKRPWLSALVFAVFPAIQLLWEHTHGGVVSHYVLHRKDMPAISNWWGLVTIPLLAWIAFSLIRRRKSKLGKDELSESGSGSGTRMDKAVVFGFTGGLVFGIVLASFWELNLDAYMPPLLLIPLVLAFFLPTYRIECLLGFVLAMGWTFGGVLPLAIGSILLIGAWIVHKGIRGGILRLIGRSS